MKNVDTVKNPLPFTNKELAIRLAAQGWKIFPCREGENAKAPYNKGGFTRATSDPQQIEKWWKTWPDALVGFPPGPNGLLVIDQDVKGGTNGVKAWRKLSDAWQDAIGTRTPSGGCHDWFLAPKRTIGNGRGQLPKGIDVRCDGGYVCLGTLGDGTCYAPDGELDLYELLMNVEDAESWFRPLPDDVLALLEPKKKAKRASVGAPPDETIVRSACESLDGHIDDYDTWISVGMALHHWAQGDASGLEIWEACSWAGAACEDHWDSFKDSREDGVSIGTVFHLAEAAGWTRETAEQEALAGFEALAQSFRETGHTRREAAAEGGEEAERVDQEAAGFHELLEALADAKPDELTLDLKLRELAAMPGAPGLVALRKAYAGIRRARAKQTKDGQGVKFPDELPLTGAARVNSLNNIEAWLDDAGLDIWFDEWAEVVRIGDRVFDDHDLRRITRDMHKDKLFADRLIKQAVDTFAFERRAHPVKDWLEDAARAWDGRERLDYWLEDYCGAPSNAAWQAVARLVLVAVVGRVFCPGVKWDSVLTFIGEQGFNKSTACRVLAIRDEWYLEGFKLKWSMKEVIENTEGKLIWEYAEFSGHKAADQDELKDAVTRTADKARKAYEQYVTERRRQGVIIGTSNEDTPLHDTTGNRRYWPLKLAGPIDTKGLRAELEQLYGEAVHAWQAFEAEYRRSGIMLPREHWAYFGTLQEDARMKVSMEERIEHHMQGIDEGHLLLVTLFDLLDVRVNDKYAGRDIGRVLERLGWEKKRTRFWKDSQPRTYFVKGAQPERIAVVCAEGLNGKSLHVKKLH